MKLYISFLFILILVQTASYGQNPTPAISEGPFSGTIIAIGGHASDDIFLPLVKEKAGNSSVKLVVIPTARGDEFFEDDSVFIKLQKRFAAYAFESVEIMHTRSKQTANKKEFVAPLLQANAVWIMGGRQWRLADAYLNTLTHQELFALLKRGGVIAGTSAGATIMGSYMVRGDTGGNTIMMGDHEKSFGFLKNTAIDQHLLARNRHFDMFEVLRKRPELLGIGLDENTAIVVKKNQIEVAGESYVAIYDGTRWSEERDTIYPLPDNKKEFYFIKPGDRYDLKNRKIILE